MTNIHTTDTRRSGDLVESLRDMPVWPMEEAADCIEALEAENERLRVECQAQYDRGYYDGRQCDGAEERGNIVEWLRKEAIMSTDTVRRRMNKALDQIEAGEHLK